MTSAVRTSLRRTSWEPFDANEVRDLYDDYALMLDAGDYAAWLELFVPDASYTVISRENVERGLPLAVIRCESRGMMADRVDALESTQFYARRFTRHMVSALCPVAHDAGVLATTANFVVAETIIDESTQLAWAGRYDDRIVRVDDRLQFVEKTAVYDSAMVPTSLIVPL